MLADLVARGRPDAGLRPVPAGRGADRARRAAGARRGRPGAGRRGCPPTAAATCRRSGGRWRPRWSAVSCSAWPPRTRWSSASTSPGWTPWWWPASPAPGPRSGSRPAGPGGPATRRWSCWWPATTRWTPTWCTIPTPCSAPRWRAACSIPPTRTCWRPQLACAAAELPLTEADVRGVRRRGGRGGARRAGGRRCAAPPADRAGSGRRRRTGPPARWTSAGPGRGRWPWSRSTPAGCWARSRAPPRRRPSHAGAVYLHRGESYVVDDLDLDAGLALVHAADAGLAHRRPRRPPTSRWCGSPSTATTARCGCRSARSP